MKAEIINYFAPASVLLTGKQLSKIHAAWREKWSPPKGEEPTEEDILTEAVNLGFVELPDGWKA